MTSFQRTGRRERLFLGPSPQGEGIPLPIGSRDAAFALLRDLWGDLTGRAALRRLYAESVGRTAVCWETDQAVLEGLARRLVTRQLKAWYVPLPAIAAPAGSLLPVPEPRPPDEEPTPAPEEPEEKKKHRFTLRLLDQAMKAIEGVDITFQIDGETKPRVKATDGSGEATITDGEGTSATAKIKDIAKVRKILAARKTLENKVPDPLPEHTEAVPLSDVIPKVSLSKEVRETLIVTRPVFRARFLGGQFETNKTFPKQDIVAGLRRALAYYHETRSKEPRELLVVGHTDTVGDKGYNLKLSLERARTLKECLAHDAKPWVDRFSKSKVGGVWGKPEIEHMLCALDRKVEDAEVDSTAKSAPKLESLVKSYMALCGPKSTLQVVAHGCGENFPEEDAGEDDNEKKENRRVEVFFFAGPIVPEPPGETSAAGSKEYPAWRKEVEDTVNFRSVSVKVRASLFFDGTMNNRANTKARLDGKAEDDADTSYGGAYSNVSKLEEILREQEGYDLPIKIYTEGIGTTNNEDDSGVVGGGLGAGDTGVVGKVHKAFLQLRDRLLDDCSALDCKHIERLELDTFGFSRGAAAARYFVYVALHGATSDERKGFFADPLQPLADELKKEGCRVCRVKVRFVGLFDTVASYQKNHDDDTAQLHLDAISVAEKVVQLAASEEHRKNFRLTSIDSARSQGTGIELFLPGCHSDVGGGYRYGSDKTQLYDMDVVYRDKDDDAKMEGEKKWFVDMGWYKAEELKETFTNEIIGTRTFVSNSYDLVALHLMARYAKDLKLSFTTGNYPIPAGLQEAKSKIDAYIASLGPDPESKIEDWFEHPGTPSTTLPWLKKLRHDYLHFSSRYGTTLGAHGPNMVGDRRKRRINWG